MSAPTLADQALEVELTYLESRNFALLIADRVTAGKFPREEYEKRKARLPALMAARDTLKNLAATVTEQTP